MTDPQTTALQACPGEAALRCYVQEQLSPDVAGGVERHVQFCAACQQVLDRLVGTIPGVLVPEPLGPDDEPPTIAGHEVLGRLAAGGMGVVWRARDSEFGRLVAIKVMKGEASLNERLVRRFFTEARVTAQLAHPSIVPVYARGRLADGRPYYCMKLVRGQTLDALLRGQPGPADRRGELVQVFAQICQAMAYAHGNGVIHRDLKPANVMVGEHGEVQVMDWGLAKVLGQSSDPLQEAGHGTDTVVAAGTDSDETQAGSEMGTFAYMPPEQANGEVERVDRRSDVFSLGAILYEILTGQPPYTGAVRRRAKDADLDEARDRLRRCGASAELIGLAELCLAPRQEHRPADAGRVAEAVAVYQASVQERLQRETMERVKQQVRAEEERRRRKLWTALAAAVFAGVVLAAGVGVYWQSQQAERRSELTLVEEDLRTAEEQILSERWGEARESLGRAEGRLGQAVPSEHQARYARLLSAWALARDLDQIQTARTTAMSHGLFENARAMKEYQRRFADEGLDPVAGNLEEAARAVRESLVRNSVLAALDNWVLVCRYRIRFDPERAEEYRAQRDRLLALARAVDPDPGLRDQLRDPRIWDDAERLRPLTDAARRADLSPSLVGLFADVLKDAKLDAEGLLRHAQERHQNDFWLNYLLGVLLGEKYEVISARGEPEEAEGMRYLQAALALRLENSAVLNAMGNVMADMRKYPEAVSFYRRAIRADPANATAHNNLGTVFRDQGDHDEAIRQFRAALEIHSHYVMPHLNLGSELSRLGRIDEAVPHFEKAMEIDPRSAAVYYRFANCLQDHGRLDEAEKWYRKALELKSYSWPPHSWIHNNFAETLAKLGRVREAREHFEKAMPDPRNAYPRTNLGTLLEETGGDLKAAIALHREALEINPKFKLASDNLRRAERLVKFTALLDKGGRPETADECLGFAEACRYRNRDADAVRHYAEAFRREPGLADHRAGRRFDAACAAAGHAELRQQALTWLAEDLAAWRREVLMKPESRLEMWEKLRPWRWTRQLASVREAESLRCLPDAEAEQWRKLWADLDALLRPDS